MGNFDPIPTSLIEEQFTEFLYSIDGGAYAPIGEFNLILDKKTRYKVQSDKGSKTSGVYMIHSDGCPAGYAINYKVSGEPFNWRFDFRKLKGDSKYNKLYALSQTPEFKAEAERVKREHEKQEAKEKAEALEKAKKEFAGAVKLINPELEYLKRKNVKIFGELKSDAKGNIILPLRNIKGEFMSLQRIAPSGDKLFASDTVTAGAFFNIDLDKAKNNLDKPIIICEGYATGATLYELTNCPVVCAMNCYNLARVCESIRKKFKSHKIIIMADNDAETKRKTGVNPGVDHALEANKKFNLNGVFYPEFSAFSVAAGKSDWNDYYCEFGEQKTRAILDKSIKYACMTEEEREEFDTIQKMRSVRTLLSEDIQIPPQETIARMFPRDYISVIASAPGVGKTWGIQRIISDLSRGGAIFNGFAYEDKPLKTVTLAGEAGENLLITRAKLTHWGLNRENAVVYDQYKCFEIDIDFTLNTDKGIKNFETMVNDERPDIVFIDSLISFYKADESKVDVMNKTVHDLQRIARKFHMAIVIIHHIRKRKANERNLSITLDDLIGSSAIIRYANSVISIEREFNSDKPEDARVNIVRQLKSWDRKFEPFSFKLVETDNGDTDMEINLDPPQAPSLRALIWEYILRTYGEIKYEVSPDDASKWFKAGDIKDAIQAPERSITRALQDLVNQGKLKKRGEKKGTEYIIKKFYD